MAPATYTVDDLAQIDFDHVVESVRGAMRCHSRDEAEDAVQEAIVRTMGRLDKLERRGRIDGFIVHAAKEKVVNHRRLRESGNISLDFLEQAEPGEDRPVKPVAIVEDDLDSVMRLSEAEDDPISRAVAEAAAKGFSARVMGRGAGAWNAKYSDEQVAAVCRLKAEGKSYAEIEAATGVHPSNYWAWTHGVFRTETTEGWDAQQVVAALRRYRERTGRVPRIRDCSHDITMPSEHTVRRYFSTHRAALEAAGMESPYGDRSERSWDMQKLAEALRQWRREHGGWPSEHDLATAKELPSSATVRRYIGCRPSAANFGTKLAAAVNSGAKHKPRRRKQAKPWTEAAVLRALRRFHRKYGRAPRVDDALSYVWMPDYTTVRRKFGGLPAAIEAAGLGKATQSDSPRAERKRRYTSQEVADRILAFEAEHQRWPTSRDFKLNPALPSKATVLRRFGSTEVAVTREAVRKIKAAIAPPDELSPRRRARTLGDIQPALAA